MFRLHSLLGLCAGLALFVVGSSGSLLVFSEGLDQRMFRDLHHVSAGARRLGYDGLFEAARQRNPQAHSVRVRRFAIEPQDSVEFLIGHEHGGTDVWTFEYVDPYTGSLLGQRGAAARGGSSNPFGVVLALHANLLLGKPGRAVLGVLSVLLLGSALSGALVYRRSIAQVLRFRVRIRRGNARGVSSAAHRVVGVWALAFNAIMATTGFWMARAAFRPAFHRPASSEVQPALSFSLDQLLADIHAHAPDFIPRRMNRVGVNGEARILGAQHGQPSWLSPLSSHAAFDAGTGRLARVALISEASFAEKLESSIKPLHFGSFGGGWSRAAYVLLGLSLPLLSATGLVLWWRSGRAARRSRVLPAETAALRGAGGE